MCYVQEGYIQSSNAAGSLGLEQLKTIFYSLLAVELIGFVVRICENFVKGVSASSSSLIGFAIGTLENVAKTVLKARTSETSENSSPSMEGKYPMRR